MPERGPRLLDKMRASLRRDNDATDQAFLDQFDTLQALRDPKKLPEAEKPVQEELRRVAQERGVTLFEAQTAQREELAQLPLRDIEAALGVTGDDEDYGRTRYINVFPREQRESASQARRVEREYNEVMSKLRQKTAKGAR